MKTTIELGFFMDTKTWYYKKEHDVIPNNMEL